MILQLYVATLYAAEHGMRFQEAICRLLAAEMSKDIAQKHLCPKNVYNAVRAAASRENTQHETGCS
jgi:hypothetical protein